MIIGYIATVLLTLAYTPQLVKTFKSKKVEGLSYFTTSILIIGLIFWCIYALNNKDWPLLVSSFLSLVQNLILIFLYFRYV